MPLLPGLQTVPVVSGQALVLLRRHSSSQAFFFFALPIPGHLFLSFPGSSLVALFVCQRMALHLYSGLPSPNGMGSLFLLIFTDGCLFTAWTCIMDFYPIIQVSLHSLLLLYADTELPEFVTGTSLFRI